MEAVNLSLPGYDRESSLQQYPRTYLYLPGSQT
jgi:hypothetical protein